MSNAGRLAASSTSGGGRRDDDPPLASPGPSCALDSGHKSIRQPEHRLPLSSSIRELSLALSVSPSILIGASSSADSQRLKDLQKLLQGAGEDARLSVLTALLSEILDCSAARQAQLEDSLVAVLSTPAVLTSLPSLLGIAFRDSKAGPRHLPIDKLSNEAKASVALALLELPEDETNYASEGIRILHSCCRELDPAAISAFGLNVLIRILPALKALGTSIDPVYLSVSDALSRCLQARSQWLASVALPAFSLVDPQAVETIVDRLDSALLNTPVIHNMPENNIAGIVEELGPACTASKSTFLDVLHQCQKPDETAVGQLLAFICSSLHTPGPATAVDPYGYNAIFSAVMRGDLDSVPSPDNSLGFKLEPVMEALKEAAPSLNWKRVAESLDCERFLIKNSTGFVQLIAAVKRGLGSDTFPLQAVLSGLWKNPAGQISFLTHAVTAPAEVISFNGYGRSAPPVEGLHAGKSSVGTPNHAWLSLDLLELLGRLTSAGYKAGVAHVLEYPLKHCPEVLLVSLASCNQDAAAALWNEVGKDLLPSFVASHPNSSAVLHRVWHLNREAVLTAMRDLYSRDPTSMSRILDVCQDLKILTEVLGSMPFPFVLELAALAARREYLNLDKWLQDRLASFGSPFVMAVADFLNSKAVASTDEAAVPQIQLSADVQALFLHFLSVNSSIIPLESRATLKKLQAGHVDKKDEQPSGAATSAINSEEFPPEIEEEANSLFQKMFAAPQSIDEIVAMLKRFKSSSAQHDSQLYNCMIHNLLDESRFFHNYPDEQLKITAMLFGSMVQHQVLPLYTHGLVLRYVLDSLRKPAESKMFKFGVEALKKFYTSLGLQPQYCHHLLQLQHLRKNHPELCTRIEKQMPDSSTKGIQPQSDAFDNTQGVASGVSVESNGIEGARHDLLGADTIKSASIDHINAASLASDVLADVKPPTLSSLAASVTSDMPTEPTSTTSAQPASPAANPAASLPSITHLSGALAGSSGVVGFASTINAETLEQAAEHWKDFPVPDQALQDKVHFLINNVSESNLESKIDDIQSSVAKEFWPWFANYMVVKRAAQEPNFHEIYLKVLERMANDKLLQLTVKTTHHYVRILLASQRIKTDSGERSLLKNLGSFLGRLTIAKNYPVLQRDLDVKAIIIEAYQTGKMIAVIPFVHKILDSCKLSTIFKPPNPWVMGILSLMTEIYGMPKLKLNISFEIEMLFRDLDLKVSEVSPSELLVGKEREMDSNNDFQQPAKSSTLSHSTMPATPEAVVADVVGKPAGSMDASSISSAQSAGVDQQTNLNAYVKINPQLAPVAERLQLKRVVPVAVDRAICEIITPVVERSVAIACSTTQELVLKDFAMEPDENRMRTAAHQMVSSLAGSLALVTCKEPLRVSLLNQLRQLLAPSCPEQTILESTSQLVSQDNLDLGCTIIEKAATDKAVRDIDERLLQAYQHRQEARLKGLPFYDAKVEVPPTLPDVLRPRPGHINPYQQRVYEDFDRVPRVQRALASSTMSSYGAEPSESQHKGLMPSDDATAALTSVLQSQYGSWQQHLDEFTMKDPTGLFGAQPEGSEGRQLMAELADMCRKTIGREALSNAIGESLFRALIAGPQSRMHITAYVTALEVLREAAGFRQLPLKITQWYISVDEERRWSRPATEALIRAHLLHLPDLDAFLAKSISTSQVGPVFELALHLVNTCIAKEAVISAGEFYNTLDILAKVATRSPGGGALMALIEQAKQVSRARMPRDAAGRPASVVKPQITKEIETAELRAFREQVAFFLEDWARLLEANRGDRVQSAYVMQLQQAGLLKGDAKTQKFLRTLIELAVYHFLNKESSVGVARPASVSFVAVDAVVALLMCLTTSHGLGTALVAKSLVCISEVLQSDADERGGAFNGRPYFRLFIGLISELSAADPSDSNGYLTAIAAALLSLNPLRIPGFAFSWLELISHRKFMPKLLSSSNMQARSTFQQLLLMLLRFLEPHLRHAQLVDSIRVLYRGALRVLLVLLHDFPEFVCEHHFVLCDAIPPSCIQMRNLILSAFPRNMLLPNPFDPNLNIDHLPEVKQAPRIAIDEAKMLPAQFKSEVDSYLATRQPSSFLSELRPGLMLSQQDQATYGTRYNVPLMNALVLYVGIQAISISGRQTQAMDIYQRLIAELDSEGCYLFLNAIANHLRYPNNHTHYFSNVVLHLFEKAQQESPVKEQITRVMLDRLIVQRPHPWGLLFTFLQLMHNPRYSFWSHPFTRKNKEVEDLFKKVDQSCQQRRSENELLVKQQQTAAIRS